MKDYCGIIRRYSAFDSRIYSRQSIKRLIVLTETS